MRALCVYLTKRIIVVVRAIGGIERIEDTHEYLESSLTQTLSKGRQ